MPSGWPDSTRRYTGADMYEVVSAASNNAASIKGSAGVVVGYYVANTGTDFRYVKLYDKASSPSPGSDTPKWVIGVPAASAAHISLLYPLTFSSGIGIAIVVGISNTDNTSVAASELVASIAYI